MRGVQQTCTCALVLKGPLRQLTFALLGELRPVLQLNNHVLADYAAIQLGMSPSTFKRYANHDELLVEGQHWRRGPHRQSPRVWNTQPCYRAMSWQERLGLRHTAA